MDCWGVSADPAPIMDVATAVVRQAQIVGTVRIAAAEVSRAVSDATRATLDAAVGLEVTDDGVMPGVAAASDQIGAIVLTITAIAEQANVLALHAAAEASRTRDQGRGFATVAGRVGKLAEESQLASQEFSALVAATQSGSSAPDAVAEAADSGRERDQRGTTSVEQACEAFRVIASSVDAMTALIKAITASTLQGLACGEQAPTSTAAIAASAREISGNTGVLRRLASQFAIDG